MIEKYSPKTSKETLNVPSCQITKMQGQCKNNNNNNNNNNKEEMEKQGNAWAIHTDYRKATC
jgi:hypothetical protein